MLRFVFALAAAALFPLSASAQTATAYPARPIRLIVPVPPGGSTDALARIISVRLAESLGQQIVIDNRAGAGGNIAMGVAAKSTPDGHVLIIVSSNFVVNPSLYAQVPYDPLKDFAPVTYIASAPSLLVEHPSINAKTVKELVALIKSSPGKFNYASPGSGSAQHLAGELFKLAAGVDVAHVPFSGAGPAVIAVLGGQVQLAFASLPAVLPHANAGTLRTLAITSNKRSPAAPDVPTFIEAGFPAVESDHLQGILAPAGTPPAIVNRLNIEIVKIINAPDVRKRLIDLGFVPVGNTPQEFAEVIKFQVGKWSKIVKDAGIRAE
ncbi:MAG: tripartite tricarboxylate transporter substrate binding protein [Betaproteobacteria bacterium]|nr:tripartite tricarboxylate transporter substrate binding protein [Betaproteobacteria bacterium]